MSIEWYRAYHGMPYDPKLRVIARRTGHSMAVVVAVWSCVLDAASQHEPRGIISLDPEEVAVIQDIEFETAKAIIQEFHNKGMIDDKNKLTAWDKRQHTTSTERSQKHREKKKQGATAGNAKQQGKTAGNAKSKKTPPDTEQRRADAEQSIEDSDEDTDSDTKKDSKQKRAREEKKGSGKEKQGTEKILEQMLQTWNTEVQEKLTRGRKAVLTAGRKEQMQSRWREDFHEDMTAWKYFCEVIAASDFCMGRIEGKDWTIDLSWAVASSDNVAKILEGRFSGKKHPTPVPVCHEPLLQTGWDHVLECFNNKYGKPACQSWISGTEITGAQIDGGKAFVVITCPSRFIREWITKHYLTDLNLWWAEHSFQSNRISGTILKIKERKI